MVVADTLRLRPQAQGEGAPVSPGASDQPFLASFADDGLRAGRPAPPIKGKEEEEEEDWRMPPGTGAATTFSAFLDDGDDEGRDSVQSNSSFKLGGRFILPGELQ